MSTSFHSAGPKLFLAPLLLPFLGLRRPSLSKGQFADQPSFSPGCLRTQADCSRKPGVPKAGCLVTRGRIRITVSSYSNRHLGCSQAASALSATPSEHRNIYSPQKQADFLPSPFKFPQGTSVSPTAQSWVAPGIFPSFSPS